MAEKTPEELLDEAALDSASSVKVQYDNDFDESDLEFEDNLQVLDTKLKKRRTLVRLTFPDGTEQKILTRKLANSEIGLLEASLVSPRVLEELVDNPENTDDVVNENMDEIADNLASNQFEKMVKACVMGILKPRGITEKRLRGWDAEYVEAIYNSVMPDMGVTTSVDRFHQVDSTSEQ